MRAHRQRTIRAAAHRFGAFLALGALLLGVVACSAPPPVAARPASSDIRLKPYRALVISGIQMRDDYVIHDAGDFGDVVALFTLWGVPFDVLRLDSRTLSPADLLDEQGRARYGVVVWTARQDQYPWQPQDYAVLDQAVKQHHVSLIAIGDKIQEPVIQDLLGLEYAGSGSLPEDVRIGQVPHFITRPRAGKVVKAAEAFPRGEGAQVAVTAPDVDILATAGVWPQLTARTLHVRTGTGAVWIGGDHDSVFARSPAFIDLLRRSVVWAIGYGLYKDYRNAMLLRMDDPGSAETAYLSSYHYAQLSQTTFQNAVIAPLKAHGAKLGVAYVPAYPWLPTRSFVRSSTIDFVDPHGARQDIASTAAGLRDGIAEGVIEVHSHGFSHLSPDLETAIPDSTNWWGASAGGEWKQAGWYREFYDERRGAEVDAETQMARLTQSAEWIEQDFGRRPLVFVPSGHAISGDRYEEVAPGSTDAENGQGGGDTRIAENYTYRLAGQAGYGLALDTGVHYLGPDRVITLRASENSNAGWKTSAQANFDRGVPAVVYFHDQDLARNSLYLRLWLLYAEAMWRDVSYLSMDEWTGYLHAALSVAAPEEGTLQFDFDYDPYYGRYFDDHRSTWTLHLSDELLADLRTLGRMRVVIDEQVTDMLDAATYFAEYRDLEVPAGTGTHTIRLESTSDAVGMAPKGGRAGR